MRVLDLIERFEAAGGRLIWSEGKIKAEYPETQRQKIAPLLIHLRQFRSAVTRIICERTCPLPAELALRVGEFLETAPGNRSATASEIAEALFKGDYTLANVEACYECCEIMLQAGVLIRAADGCGYQLSCWARCDRRRGGEEKCSVHG